MEALGATMTAQLVIQDDVAGASTSAVLERLAAALGLEVACRKDGRIARPAGTGPRCNRGGRTTPTTDGSAGSSYELVMRSLQAELLKLQRSVKMSGRLLAVVFEGRDAAGKGGAIRRFTENLNPRGLRVVALDKPAARVHGERYLRRHLPHMSAPGEIVLFDHFWYNRAGVEQVMGFCRPQDHNQFLRGGLGFERMLAGDGIDPVKLWFSVTRVEQLRRFIDRQADPNVGRLLDAVEEMGDLDNTLIFYVWDDNGASMELAGLVCGQVLGLGEVVGQVIQLPGKRAWCVRIWSGPGARRRADPVLSKHRVAAKRRHASL